MRALLPLLAVATLATGCDFFADAQITAVFDPRELVGFEAPMDVVISVRTFDLDGSVNFEHGHVVLGRVCGDAFDDRIATTVDWGTQGECIGMMEVTLAAFPAGADLGGDDAGDGGVVEGDAGTVASTDGGDAGDEGTSPDRACGWRGNPDDWEFGVPGPVAGAIQHTEQFTFSGDEVVAPGLHSPGITGCLVSARREIHLE